MSKACQISLRILDEGSGLLPSCIQRGLSMRKLSVCQTRGLQQNEINFCPHSYTTRNIIAPSFLTRRMVGGVTPSLLLEILKRTDPAGMKNADFQSIIARSASAVTPSKKSSINTNRKSAAVSLCENRQRQSFKAFIGLSIRAKMVGGMSPKIYIK